MKPHEQEDLLHTGPYTSDSRWRHQESSLFHRHIGVSSQEQEDESESELVPSISKLKSTQNRTDRTFSSSDDGLVGNEQMTAIPGSDLWVVKCGPLLNYRRMENGNWFGTVLIIADSCGQEECSVIPSLKLIVSKADYDSMGCASRPQESSSTLTDTAQLTAINSEFCGLRLYSDESNTFWRFDLQVPMQEYEINCQYSFFGLVAPTENNFDNLKFFVPAIQDSMRIMFHSCNGFSVGTDEDAYSGACLWNDVLRVQKVTPFHVMIGGGDQIYNDGIRVDGPLRPWTDIMNPLDRERFPFPESLRRSCDKYYVNNYIRWYSTEPFASANRQIPQLNMWDDHDIIDGFGSYVDSFMKCAVFKGIGEVANKYYSLFQQHLAPPASTFTTDRTPSLSADDAKTDTIYPKNVFVRDEPKIDSSYILGARPGPYLNQHSRSIFTKLGARISFIGIDARTERTRTQVNYPETYEIIFKRIQEELDVLKVSSSPIQHLIVLLGIPIAYPRLTWLENIISSPAIAPMKFLNKRFGFGGSLFNHFDGSVDLLDDLDDHYTARAHKNERRFLIQQLQVLAKEYSVRITILGGDVHLSALGRFYSNPDLDIPVSEDHRYMVNVISSAIVNKPPPQAVANLIAKRNKIHHLDEMTDESMLRLFDRDPVTVQRPCNSNHITMPRRNWAMITENSFQNVKIFAPEDSNNNKPFHGSINSETIKALRAIDKHSWLHDGEVEAGSRHRAADSQQHGKGMDGGLDVCIRVEINQHDKTGRTLSYGMTIPSLTS